MGADRISNQDTLASILLRKLDGKCSCCDAGGHCTQPSRASNTPAEYRLDIDANYRECGAGGTAHIPKQCSKQTPGTTCWKQQEPVQRDVTRNILSRLASTADMPIPTLTREAFSPGDNLAQQAIDSIRLATTLRHKLCKHRSRPVPYTATHATLHLTAGTQQHSGSKRRMLARDS